MMVVIRVPSVTHQRLQHIRKQPIKPGVLPGQDSSIVDVVMKQKREWSTIVGLHDPMKDGMRPGKVMVEVESTRY